MSKKNAKESRIKTLIFEYAPKAKNIKDLCEKSGIPRSTLYRYMVDMKVKKALEKLIAKDVPLPKIKKNIGLKWKNEKILEEIEKKKRPLTKEEIKQNRKAFEAIVNEDIHTKDIIQSDKTHKEYKTLTVTIPVRQKGFTYTKEERWEYGSKICEMVEQGATINNSCEALGLDPSTFYKWVSPISTSYIEELALRLKEARSVYSLKFEEEIVVIARESMRKLLNDRTTTRTVTIGKVDKESGKVIPHTVKRDESIKESDKTIIKMVAESLIPAFKPAIKNIAVDNQQDSESKLRLLTDAELEEELNKINNLKEND